MLFHTYVFIVFFLVVLGLFYSLPLRTGRIMLLVASYFFYSWWNPKFVLLLFLATLIDYFSGRLLASADASASRRRHYLLLSLLSNLGILGFFKYYNFFAGSLAALLGLPPDSFLLQIVLPVGISFHTFQGMSYTIDVYYDRIKPVTNFIDFALFIAFFPQLVAGHIVRASDFFPDLYHWKKPDAPEVQTGIFLMLMGFTKKMVFADQFAKISDLYFGHVAAHPGMLTAWSGTIAFALQIFFDFSGYTDIAIGCAKIMGFHFPVNFRRPYLAHSVAEFWQRWHISLSFWLRDYLFIPLSRNRKGTWNSYINLMITMLLAGLWHGASWNFVAWGGYHGLLQVLGRMWQRGKKRLGLETQNLPGIFPGKILFTFLLVTLGWVFFRAATWQDSFRIFHEMFRGSLGQSLLGPGHFALAGISLLLAILQERYAWFEKLITAPPIFRVSFYVLLFFMLELFAVTGEKIPFIYFQF